MRRALVLKERAESLKNAIMLPEQACPSWLRWQGEVEGDGVRASGEDTPVGWEERQRDRGSRF